MNQKPTTQPPFPQRNQQDGCAAYAHKEKKQKKAKPQRDDERTEQEKEFDHVLMGYYGG